MDTARDDRPPVVWDTPEEAEEALEDEYGMVPTAEFFDFGESAPYEIPGPVDDDDDEGGAAVLRVLR